MIIKTKELILKPDILKDDIFKIHQNVFSQTETAKYMLWKASNEIEDTIKRLKRWQESDIKLFFIFEKSNNEPIGFLSFSERDEVINNIGLCIGKRFVRKGFGKQVLTALLDYCKNNKIKIVEYSAFHENLPSIELAKKLGFIYSYSKNSIRNYDKRKFVEDVYVKKLIVNFNNVNY